MIVGGAFFLKALIVGGGVAAEIHCKVLTQIKVEIVGIMENQRYESKFRSPSVQSLG